MIIRTKIKQFSRLDYSNDNQTFDIKQIFESWNTDIPKELNEYKDLNMFVFDDDFGKGMKELNTWLSYFPKDKPEHNPEEIKFKDGYAKVFSHKTRSDSIVEFIVIQYKSNKVIACRNINY